MESFAQSLLTSSWPYYVCLTPAVIVTLVGVCWGFLGLLARRETTKLKESSSSGRMPINTEADEDETAPVKFSLPAVTSIQAVKGVHSHSLRNWHSQVDSFYRGKRECIFVVESKNDPAYEAVQQFRQELISRGNTTDVRIVVAGLSYHCSQKLHNMLFGIASASCDSEYVLFMDDDAAFYPCTIETLVKSLEGCPGSLVATGHPFAYLPKDANMWSYCRFFLEQMKLLGSVAPSGPGHCVWGGCMMVRLSDLRSNSHGIIDAWQQFGYSDDMIIGGISAKHNRASVHPMTGFFPNELPRKMPFGVYWNQMYRQMFVLSTYRSNAEFVLNHLILAGPSIILPSTMWLPTMIALCQLGLLAGQFISGENISFSALSCVAFVLYTWTVAVGAIFFMNAGLEKMCSHLAGVGSFGAIRNLSPLKLAVAGCLHLFLITIAAIVSFVYPSVSWAGIKYWKRGGKVVKVVRPDGSTRDATESYCESRGRFQQYLKTDAMRIPVRNLDNDQVAHVYVEKSELIGDE